MSGQDQVGEIWLNQLSAPRRAFLSADGRLTLLLSVGETLQCYRVRDSQGQRAQMLLYLARREGRIYWRGGITYAVTLGKGPETEMTLRREGSQPGVMTIRWRYALPGQLQSEVKRGEFQREETITLVSLAVFHLLMAVKLSQADLAVP